MELPYLASISIYPIKSLDAVSVKTARVLAGGALADDRRFAIVDAQGKYVNGKRNARIHLLRSAYDAVTRNLKLAVATDSQQHLFDVDAERVPLEEWFGEFFGFPVTFTENNTAGFPDDTDSPGPTLISTATLREVASWFGMTAEQTRARFRANLEVDGVPPFWEDQLYGQRGTTVRFSIGDVVFDGVNPCQRCVVPARDPITGEDNRDFARRFVEMRRKLLPEWAEASRFNHYYRLAVNTKLVGNKSAFSLSIGDRVKIIGSTTHPAMTAPPPAVDAPPARWSGPLRVTRVCHNTPTVGTFRLALHNGDDLPFAFLPGQFLNIELTIDGVLHRRCYTIASSPAQTKYCEITVRREVAGTVSRFLHDHFREGMQLHVSGPNGRFTFNGSEANAIVLIGAGVGITPLMSVIRYLTDRKWPGEIHLIYCARTEEDIIFKEELKFLSRSFSNLRVTTTLTQEPGARWTGARGRISAQLLRRALPQGAKHRVHICGPTQMATDVTQMLRDAGVAADQIRSEAFGGAVSGPTHFGESIGTVTFTNSGKSAPIHLGQTVLDVAGWADVAIDHGCLAGVCGRCKVRLLSGEVDMDANQVLTSNERTSGIILACQARANGNIAIEA